MRTTRRQTWLGAIALLVVTKLAVSVSVVHAQDAWIDKDASTNYTARHEASFVQAGDQFYLFGGRENARTLDVYDYTSNTWSRDRDARAPIEFNHFQATEYQGLIWVIGAFRTNSFPRETPAEAVYVFDPANNAWMKGPSIPESRRRGSTGLVVHDDKFYVVGGNTVGHDGGFVSWFDEFDPQTGTWTPLSDAPRPRDHFHAEVANEKLYAIGGRRSGGPGGVFAPLVAEVDVYDFQSNTWSTLPSESDLPTPRAAASVAKFDERILVIGGEGNGRAYDTVEALDPTTNTWETLPSMNYRRHGTQAIVSGEGVYIAVGSPNQGGGNQRNMEVFGRDEPAGSPSVAGVLSTLEAADIVVGSPEPIRMTHVGGNQGVFVEQISISGDNASDFSITRGDADLFLIPIDGQRDILVEYTGDIDNATASLDIAFAGSQTMTVQLTGMLVPEPSSWMLLTIGVAGLSLSRARRCEATR